MSTDQLGLVRFEGDEEDESAENVVAGGATAVVAPYDWTAGTLVDQLARKRIELSPGFQRRDAWQPTRKSRFIESLIVGIPVPQVLLAESQSQPSAYVVIDGKQRLLALQQFFENGLVLQGLNIREDLNGETFESLQEADRDRLENQTLRAVLLRNWSNVDFLYHVFIRLNSESLPLSPQELRGALFPGPFLDYADELTTSSTPFHRMLRLSGPDFRMRDIELLVRFFAFDFFLEEYQGNLRGLLDDTCKWLNRLWGEDDDRIRSRGDACESAIMTVLEVFGDAAFRRWDGDRLVGPFNRAVFDCLVMYAKEPEIAEQMRLDPERTVQSFKQLCQERRFTESVSSTTKSVANTRYRLTAWAAALGASIAVDVVPPVVGGE